MQSLSTIVFHERSTLCSFRRHASSEETYGAVVQVVRQPYGKTYLSVIQVAEPFDQLRLVHEVRCNLHTPHDCTRHQYIAQKDISHDLASDRKLTPVRSSPRFSSWHCVHSTQKDSKFLLGKSNHKVTLLPSSMEQSSTQQSLIRFLRHCCRTTDYPTDSPLPSHCSSIKHPRQHKKAEPVHMMCT